MKGKQCETCRGEAMDSNEMRQIAAERDSALLSLDKVRIAAYMEKHGVDMPQCEKVFWLGVHKARTGSLGLPRSERLASAKYLAERGSSHFMDDITSAEAADWGLGGER